MSYEIGSRIGDYEILEILGAGGMGRVYKVRNVISDRIEAMKVLLPDLESNVGLADRFMREIKVQASLDHPNIAALHTALRLENQLMMLMEYVEGTTLEKMMEAGPVPVNRAADYIAQVLSALSYAHARGVVHRDLKPANMMVTANGLVKLMDFGIAKMTADRKLTQTGSTVGSLYYMSPEQIKGAIDLDPRSDLYSLGVSLYEIATGARPFQGDSEYSIMAAHLQSNPPPPIQLSPNLPPGLSEVILQSLEKDPAKRFQTADAFRTALLYVCKSGQGAASTPAPAAAKKSAATPPPKSAVSPQARPASSHRGLWIAIGAVIAIAVIVVVAMQIPKFRRTAAESAASQAPADVLPADSSPVPESTPATASAESQAPSMAASDSAPAQVSTTAPLAETAGTVRPSAIPAAAVQTPRSAMPRKAAPQGAASPAIESSASRQPVSESMRPESVQSSPLPPAPPAEEAKTAGQLKEVQEQLSLLSIRAETVRGSLDNLRRQQADSGLGLRADMANSAQRMEHYFSQIESALKQRDAEAAKKNLDLAEREVTKLENFLHR
jgi:eukaryotic-like serine/threonine-protein kinase